ncbi:hypothetical protein OG760_33265 [Streptomyces sp. NBC_00963]|uniref:hypothetical protein n=1 Tax=Streptomyces sp. NBC_00963 TaxID=2903697 RepID=UPI00386AE856|nr:hypothetical protein OG760_33265 [Streptomyces sp. NBC_00963]
MVILLLDIVILRVKWEAKRKHLNVEWAAFAFVHAGTVPNDTERQATSIRHIHGEQPLLTM